MAVEVFEVFVAFGTVAGGFMIHGVFGSYTLWAQYHGIIDAVSILKTQGAPAAMMAVIDTLPFSKVVMLIYCAFSTIFLATTVNSGCYVVAATATRRMPVDADLHVLGRGAGPAGARAAGNGRP